MRKSKKIMCILGALLIALSCGFNAFASGWEWWQYADPINPTNIEFSNAQYQGYYSVPTQECLISAVNNATKCNAFNGALPVAITMTISDSSGTESANGLSVWCITPPDPNLIATESLKNVRMETVKTSDNVIRIVAYSRSFSYALQEYQMTENGSFIATGVTKYYLYIYPYLNAPTAEQRLKLVGLWNNISKTIERENTNTEMQEYYTAYYTGMYGNITLGLAQTAKEHWENVTENVIVNETIIVSNTLDIPAIITSIPNATKQFINNAFGFELFGINVAGLLSVLLVVAIVAFVVGFLLKK